MFPLDPLTALTNAAARRRPISVTSAVVLVLLSLLLMLFACSARAEVLSPQWTVTAVSRPTHFARSSTGQYIVEVKNTGGAPSNGSALNISDTLPAGMSLAGSAAGKESLSGAEVNCTGAACTYSGVVQPDASVVLTIPVEVAAAANETETNEVTASGGGAPEAVRETPTVISPTPASFGIAAGSLTTTLSSAQAGAHADLTTTVAFSTLDVKGKLAAPPRNTVADLPPGFVGDLADSPTCPVATFDQQVNEFQGPQPCGLSTQVGTTSLELAGPTEVDRVTVPVYNLTPNPGEVAKLGFVAVQFGIQGTASLRPGDYGIRTSFRSISTVDYLDSVSLTIWGVPSAASHDPMRGLICNGVAVGSCAYHNATPIARGVAELPEGQSSTSPEIPYLTSPTACTGAPLEASFTATSWDGGEPVTAQSPLGPLTGCGLLEFTPVIAASPDTDRADTPAGLTADVKAGQEGLVSAEGFSTADLKDTTVKLPAGVVINPGQAAGLEACQLADDGVGQEGPASCPNGSIIGTAAVETPLLKHKLEGNVYLLQSNPPNLKLLVTAYAPIYGIYVKLVGDVHLDPATGQLTTTFEETPELPFSDFKLSFNGGAQAALVTPTHCGTYTTNADFTPWTTPIGGDAFSSSEFAITSGTRGAACPPASLPFTPSLTAGATTDQAGGFTHFSMLLTNPDDQQRISKLQFKAPPGLAGLLSSVPLCGEPQAANGTCPATSQIGHTVIASGPGPYPLVVPQPGQPPAAIYLTGPYDGAPFGLSIVVPVVVGPFVLETQIVRARIDIDPHTAQITVTTDPLPQIIDGIPTDLRTINAVIDRDGFMFNPTSCNPLSFTGSATSAEGANAPISTRFQVGSCESLKFTPKITVSTAGKVSRANGASLHFKIAYPKGAMGTQTWFNEAKFQLPKQLPTRNTTLQKACLASVFETNPAGCPSASRIGQAIVHTPVLPVPLQGPVYFVSNGGAKFPNAVMLLQGDGVTVKLTGETYIAEKTNITSATFADTPDVPFESIEVTLPQGPFSEFGAYLPASAKHGFCGQKLKMPTYLKAQNGLEIHQNTPITVTGCHRTAKKATRARHTRKARHSKHN